MTVETMITTTVTSVDGREIQIALQHCDEGRPSEAYRVEVLRVKQGDEKYNMIAAHPQWKDQRDAHVAWNLAVGLAQTLLGL